jgi:hypothetical protein
MRKELRTSIQLRAFDWDVESSSLTIEYRNLDSITFFNVPDEIVESFTGTIFKGRFVKVLKTNPAHPHNFAKRMIGS